MTKLRLIRLLSSVSDTSAPYNSFTLFTHKYYDDIEQIVFICSDNIPKSLYIPDGLDIRCIEKKSHIIYREIKKAYDEAVEAGKKVIIHMHYPDSAFLFLIQSLIRGSIMRKFTVYNVHSLFTAYPLKVKALVAMNLLLARKVCFVGETSYESSPSLIRHIRNDALVYIQNGFDNERVERNIDWNIKRDDKLLAYVARLNPVKNHRFIVDLLTTMPDYRCLFIGPEDAQGEIRNYSKQKHVESQITFTGSLPRDEVFKTLNRVSLYVSSSNVEGIPVSLLEASCCGLVSVVSDIPSHIEVAKKVPSIHVCPLDLVKWKELIQSLMKNKEMRSLEGMKGRQAVIDNFSIRSMMDKYISLYNDILVNT